MSVLGAFGDVQTVMDKAAMSELGLRYRLRTYGEAVNFRQRCYRFRKARQTLAADALGYVPGVQSSTPYDDLEIFIEDGLGQKVLKKPQTSISPHFDVVLLHRVPTGQLLELSGEKIELEPTEALKDLELDLE